MSKKLWLRVGMSVDFTDEEIESIFSGCDNGIDLVQNAIKEGRYFLDGETYIPALAVEDFNDEYGTDYEQTDYDL